MINIRCEDVRRSVEEIEKEIRKIELLEQKLPEGELYCFKNGNRYKWQLKCDGTTRYIPKTELEFAQKMALKKYYKCRRDELNDLCAGYNAYVSRMTGKENKSDKILTHPEYGKLLKEYYTPLNENLIIWQKQDYEKCGKYMENKLIKGNYGNMLRSKSEAIIDMMLYKNRIPFHYEEKLELGHIVLYPDFTIRHPVTGEYYYWEHFGMMDDEEYRNNACEKINLYSKNGIIPSVNLILTFETKKYPLGADKVEKVIAEYFL